MKRSFLVLLGFCFSLSASAQSVLEQAEQAYREARYDDARTLLERHLVRNEADAPAQYLLARVYTETPLADERKAVRAIEAALEVQPENVDFLTARMMLLRSDRFTFIEDRLREQRRLDLARRILKLDPHNALAHEELGRLFIKDFWRYRNAISFPLLSHERPRSAWASEAPEPVFESGDATDMAPRQLESIAAASPDRVFMRDRFDLEALESMGVPVVSYAGRAQRAYDRAIEHLEASLTADPRRRSVYDDFMRIYALKGDWEAALNRLQDMYVHFADDPETWLYFGLAHLRAGNPEAADRSFQTAFNQMESDRRAAYEDLRLVLSPDEQAAYDEHPDAYARRFWTAEDPRLLTPYNERRLEHYARLTEADVLYRVPALDLHGWETQRGRILVRYGPPLREVYVVPSGASFSIQRFQRPANSTFLSGVEERGRQVNTGEPTEPLSAIAGDPQAASGSLPNLEDPASQFEELNTYNIWDYGGFRFVFEDPFRNGAYRLYSPSARDISQGVDAWRNDYVMLAREMERKQPQLYTYEAAGRQVELPYLVTSFRGEGGATDVYVHYGVSIPGYDATRSDVDVTASVGTFLVSPERDVLVERRRTFYGLRTDQIVQFEEANLWVDSQRMEAPPGQHELSVEFETASGGTVGVQRRPVTVPDFGGDRFSLSDLLLAYRVEEAEDGRPVALGDIVRGDLSIRPAPWSVFGRNQPLYLYYEAYGLGLGSDGQTRYEVEIELAPKDRRRGIARVVGRVFSRKDGVSLRFPGSGNQQDIAEYQILDVADQEPGLYTLTLRVRDQQRGRTETRSQDLYLE